MNETKPVLLRPPGKLPYWGYVLIGLGIVLATVGIELAMGRLFLSKSGAIELWVSETNGAETSQQMADWYSITHITHGIILYVLFFAMWRNKRSSGFYLAMVVLAEAVWEVFENTPFTINRYREATMANGYYGDSILNSALDILFCAGGYFIARHLPWWATVAFVAVTEIALALAVRDNLTLNIIMLIHPIDAIKQWQQGA